jgi:hypothetical protein
MSQLHADSRNNDYLFKVTVISSKTIVIADLGGIRLESHTTHDLGRKFPIEKIRNSKSLAELIFNMDIYAWDSHGNQIGGFDLCDVEDCLRNSCCDDARDVVIFVKDDNDCEVDQISEYVILTSKVSLLINAIYEDERNGSENAYIDASPFGTLWNFDGWDLYDREGKLDLHDLESREWVNFKDGLQDNEKDFVGMEILMLDVKSKKYYKIKFTKFNYDKDIESFGFGYVRELIKIASQDDCCDINGVTFGTNVPDACNTYLYNSFGMASNIAPHILSSASKIKSLNLSYQASLYREGSPVAQTTKEPWIRISPYFLQIEINGIRAFQIPLPGEDWIGRSLDLQNCSVLDLIEFFEGRSNYWNLIKDYRDEVESLAGEELIDLINDGCVIGVYNNKRAALVAEAIARVEQKFLLAKDAIERVAYSEKISAELEKLKAVLNSLVRNGNYVFGINKTGSPFYDKVMQIILLLRKLVLLRGDKVSVYLTCEDYEKSEVDGGIKYPANDFVDQFPTEGARDILCESVSNINFVIEFESVCDFEPIEEIDSKVIGRILDEQGQPLLDIDMDVYIEDQNSEKDWNSDIINNEYYLTYLPYGTYTISASADGYDKSESIEFTLDAKSPKVEIDFLLTEVQSAVYSGTLNDSDTGQAMVGREIGAYQKVEGKTSKIGSGKTDNSGNWSIDLVDKIGETLSYFEAIGDANTQANGTYEINSTIVNGTETNEIKLEANFLSQVSITVLNSANNSQAISGALVSLKDESERTSSGYTEGNGQSKFNLPYGTYNLEISGAGITTNTSTISIQSSEYSSSVGVEYTQS